MEDSQKKFLTAMLGLFRLSLHVKENFFFQKYYEKIGVFMEAYLSLRVAAEKGSLYVAQSRELRQFSIASNSLLDFLDVLEHLQKVQPSPLFLNRKNILNLKLSLLESVPRREVRLREDKPEAPAPAVSVPKIPAAFIRRQPKEFIPGSNREKILGFIKEKEELRTRDIIEAFPQISERTVKRNLKDLLASGFLERSLKDNGVFYKVARKISS